MSARLLPPLRLGRRVTGMSAVLLPFAEDGEIDWDALAAAVERTAAAGLVPAVNMDTGYGPSLDPATRARVLAVTAKVLGGAVQGMPQDASIRTRYALALARSGDATGARRELQVALGEGKAFDERATAEKLLRELGT